MTLHCGPYHLQQRLHKAGPGIELVGLAIHYPLDLSPELATAFIAYTSIVGPYSDQE
jgi:hypothetical protein